MRTKFSLLTQIINGFVRYTCPSCGYRNSHLWFGREFHYCSGCDYRVDVKGAL